MGNFMELKVEAIASNEIFVRNTVAAFCANENPTVEVIGDLKTAVSEAISNCVIHAYDSTEKQKIIVVRASIEERVLHIEICDFGKGIENVDEAMQNNFSTDKEQERAGIGFTIMNAFMDTLKVESDNSGTRVFMTKRL